METVQSHGLVFCCIWSVTKKKHVKVVKGWMLTEKDWNVGWQEYGPWDNCMTPRLRPAQWPWHTNLKGRYKRWGKRFVLTQCSICPWKTSDSARNGPLYSWRWPSVPVSVSSLTALVWWKQENNVVQVRYSIFSIYSRWPLVLLTLLRSITQYHSLSMFPMSCLTAD